MRSLRFSPSHQNRAVWHRLVFGVALLLMATGPRAAMAQDAETNPTPVGGVMDVGTVLIGPPLFGPSLSPKQVRAQVIAAETRIRRGKAAEAVQDLTEMGRQNPFNSAIWATRAMAFLQAGKTRRAWQDLKDAVQLDPTNRDGLYGLGALYVKLGRPALAEPVLIKLQEQCPFGCPQATQLAALMDQEREAAPAKEKAPANADANSDASNAESAP